MSRCRELAIRFRGETSLASGNLAGAAVNWIASFLCARCLQPADLGVVQSVMLVVTYAAFLHFGVFNGLSRNVALYLGKGDQESVNNMVASSWMVAKQVAALGALISAIMFVVMCLQHRDALYLWAMLPTTLLLVCEPFSKHVEVVLLSTRSFGRYARFLHWQNFGNLLVSFLPLVMGTLGYVLGRTAAPVLRFLSFWRQSPISTTQRGSWGEALNLAKIGFPLLLGGILYSYLGIADRSVVMVFMSPEDVGHMALATMAVSAIQLVPMFLSTVMYPRIAGTFGREGTAKSLRKDYWLCLLGAVCTTIPVCILCYLLVGPCVKRFLPNYVPGIRAAEITCLGCISFIYFPVSTVIAVLRRNTPYLLVMCLGLILVWLLGAASIKAGYGIEGVAISRAIATSVLCVFTVIYAYYLTGCDITPEAPAVGPDSQKGSSKSLEPSETR